MYEKKIQIRAIIKSTPLCTAVYKEGRGINRKNLNEKLETPHLAYRTISSSTWFFLLKTGILNPSPFLLFTLSLRERCVGEGFSVFFLMAAFDILY